MNAFRIQIIAAERRFYEGDCLSLTLPILDGELGVMAGHSGAVAAVVPGILRMLLPDGTEMTAAVSHGLARVENGDAYVLVGSAERPEEIDAARARRAAEQAQEELLKTKSWQEYLQTRANLARAQTRLKAANRN